MSPVHAERRLALSVGIDVYDNLPGHEQLKKAVNDARAIGATLRELGFEATLEENLSRLAFTRAWQKFLNRLEPGDTAALYFAGHGVEIGGLNYLLPRDVPKVVSGEDKVLAGAAIRFNELMDDLRDKRVRVALFIVDACRDNPFRDGSGRSVGGGRGPARVEPAEGSFVMYSAGAGEQALDRLPGADANPNSVFTRTLLPILAKPGLSLQDIAIQVRRQVVEVARGAGRKQTPAYYDQLVGEFLLRAGQAADAKPNVALAVPPQPEPSSAKDDVEAARRYKLSADRGDANAQINLGLFYEHGRGGLPKDDREAARLYKRAADQGNAVGQFNLANFYTRGRGGLPMDDREAARLYKLSADQGDADAQVILGLFYENGRGGLAKDDREAARLYKLSADQGNAQAQNNLGASYVIGFGGLPKDDREAARLYKLAADQGNADAQVNLGIFYARGRGGLPKDDREAVRLYKLSADRANAVAQNNLGSYYENGRGGLPKDDREAVRLYKLSADQGNANAQANLGASYALGFGGLPKDDREAVRLYKLSAGQGNAVGQYNLGLFYENGRGGLPKDNREAARLYKLSADQGDADAANGLKRLKGGR